MNGKRHIGKLLISIGLILIFISSSTRYIPEFKYLTDYLFLIGGLFIVSYGLISLIRKDVEINRTFNNLTLIRSEEHTSELQSRGHIVCRLLLEKKKKTTNHIIQ